MAESTKCPWRRRTRCSTPRAWHAPRPRNKSSNNAFTAATGSGNAAPRRTCLHRQPKSARAKRRAARTHRGDVEVTPLECKRSSPERRLEHPHHVGVRHQALQAGFALRLGDTRGRGRCGPVLQRRNGAQHLRAWKVLSAGSGRGPLRATRRLQSHQLPASVSGLHHLREGAAR